MSQPTTQAPGSSVFAGAHMDRELRSQPVVWRQAINQAIAEDVLPNHGERVAVIGCGTSWFMAQSYAAARESAGKGITDAFAASEASAIAGRGYDAVVAISRSGTTTEVLELMTVLKGSLRVIAVIGDVESPAIGLADDVVALPYADEQSVVQTRFATAALAYLLTSVGIDLEQAVTDAEVALAEEVSPEMLDAEQFTFLGTGWTVGLAHEAGLKMREGVQGWTESYPAMEYRHGPISIAAPGRVVWLFGKDVPGLADDVAPTGADYIHTGRHPLADLAQIHRITLARARARGLDPDLPRNLTRSVVLGS
ncbi:SIS domain-containing protein [Arthrobacter sp. H20]|uniref:SIS domain-containing protein n=1 Tax=Arthrobacter sp. H20 TaxID=1267981 RepID=UPI0004BAC9D5|nr:SIS domain-containing protein [Arthrobacter sp. H20]